MTADEQLRLRRAMDQAAAGPVDDAWAAIAGRVANADGSRSPMHPAPLAIGRRPATSWLVAAAVLAVLAGAGIAIAIAGRPGADARDEVATAGVRAAAESTGWYVPTDLPQGWQVEHVRAMLGGGSCAAEGALWTRPDQTASIRIEHRCSEGTGTQPDPDESVDSLDLGGGVTGRVIEVPDPPSGPPAPIGVSWEVPSGASAGSWAFESAGLTRAEAEAAVRSMTPDPSIDRMPDGGFEPAGTWSHPDRDTRPVVMVNLRDPEGHVLTYTLMLPGQVGPELVPRTSRSPIVTGSDGSETVLEDHGNQARILGEGADVVVDDWGSEIVVQRDVEFVASWLRPATTEEWRTFVSTAEATAGPVSAAPTLASLGDRAWWEGEQVPAGLGTEEPTTTVELAPTTTAPVGGADDERPTFTATVVEPVVIAGESFHVEVRLANDTGRPLRDTHCLAILAVRFGAVGTDRDDWGGNSRLGRCDESVDAVGAELTETVDVLTQAVSEPYGPDGIDIDSSWPPGVYGVAADLGNLAGTQTVPDTIVVLPATCTAGEITHEYDGWVVGKVLFQLGYQDDEEDHGPPPSDLRGPTIVVWRGGVPSPDLPVLDDTLQLVVDSDGIVQAACR